MVEGRSPKFLPEEGVPPYHKITMVATCTLQAATMLCALAGSAHKVR